MAKKSAFDIDFDSYILQSEPSKQEKAKIWRVAIGLQQVDRLKTSEYLKQVAKRNIEGEITLQEAKKLIDTYYESGANRSKEDENCEEADRVSARIAEVLSEKAFVFNPNQLLLIHERLFKGIFDRVKSGHFRTYNITKKEWVLDGDTVFYADFELIQKTLEYDFAQEKSFDYSTLSNDEMVKHITCFIANIWQVHPFGEGNTRTTAVFTIKYLRTLGVDAANEIFEENSWYFRNALVRANYTNTAKGISVNTEYLEKFFRNLLLLENNELKNRFTHIRYKELMAKSSEEIMRLIKDDPLLSAKEIANKLDITSRAVEKQIAKLKQKGLVKRVGSTKAGHWEVL